MDVQTLLSLRRAPIAIGFFDQPPAGLAAWDGGPVPAGCVFWTHAMAGRAFYTLPADHYNCAVGCHTHQIPLPPERAHELQQSIELMVGSEYLSMDEVPGIPTLPRSPGVVAYGPAAAPGFEPALILLALQPAQAMLLYEAMLKAGAGQPLTPGLGRPACAVLPLTLNAASAASSFGCKGNRTFTGLPDDELYLCVPAEAWARVQAKLVEVYGANEKMGAYYRGKVQAV